MTSLSAKTEMTIKILEETCGETPLYMQGLPEIVPGDWVMIQAPNSWVSYYGEVRAIIPDPYYPDDVAETYDIFVSDENRIVHCSPIEIWSHYSQTAHTELLESIKNVQIAKDMQYVTNLVISKKVDKALFWE